MSGLSQVHKTVNNCLTDRQGPLNILLHLAAKSDIVKLIENISKVGKLRQLKIRKYL